MELSPEHGEQAQEGTGEKKEVILPKGRITSYWEGNDLFLDVDLSLASAQNRTASNQGQTGTQYCQ